MKRILSILVLVAFTSVALAQTKAAPIENKAKARSSAWSQQLLLTKAQQDQVYTIVLDKLKEQKKIYNTFNTDHDTAKRDKATLSMRNTMKTKMKGVLTADQYTKWESIMKREGHDVNNSK